MSAVPSGHAPAWCTELAQEHADLVSRLEARVPCLELPLHLPWIAAINRLKHERGAVVLAEGVSAALLGELLVLDNGAEVPGLGWVEDTAIVPAVTSLAQSAGARFMLSAHRVGKVIGIGVGSALVLGPGGHIEAWGQREVTVALSGSEAGLDKQ